MGNSQFSGFLFIGDPNASSLPPKNRKDGYEKSVFSKLEQSSAIANELNLVPVILGNLIYHQTEQSIGFVCRLIKLLKQYHCPPLVLTGSNGRHSSGLVDDDVESVLVEAGVISLIKGGAHSIGFDINGVDVNLFGANFGDQIPYKLSCSDSDFNILVTHHNFNFASSYQGALELRSIPGCDMVINGHMPKNESMVNIGETCWNNVGAIEPLSIELQDQPCAVWEWRPNFSQLKPHYLTHERECFHYKTVNVEASNRLDAVNALFQSNDAQVSSTLKDSTFAELLKNSEVGTNDQAYDIALLNEDLDSILKKVNVTAATATLLKGLASKVLTASQSRC